VWWKSYTVEAKEDMYKCYATVGVKPQLIWFLLWRLS
jgi:hypothetical protein